ncbi:MAG: choice-of-anchor B family protein [candidate division Zixibacteria bacterium]|mgnify:CR=1 FL=1|nr:choice-of-anchor B family protein [candidate division Zixibacteria bacterium]
MTFFEKALSCKQLIAPTLVILSSFAIPVKAAPPQIVLGDRARSSENIGDASAVDIVLAKPADLGNDGFALCQRTTYNFSNFAGTDCWGWEENGKEYAVMGIFNGVVFVNITDNDIVDTVMGPQGGCGGTRWRDMKSYGHYLYAVSECTGTNQGLMIIDMQYLPDSVKFIKSFSSAGTDVTCHNLSIDTAKGFAYLCKSGYSGFRVISLADPENPVEFPFVNTQDIHDVFARNDTVWVAEGNRHTFSIYNMANKNAAALIARVTVPAGGYVHNVWPTADGRHIATTEETVGKTIKFWNIENLANIQLVSTYLAPSGLAHNAHFVGNRCYISHYESGVAVVDISTPSSPVEIGRVDTYSAGESGNFNGCWGVFPHTTSGKVYSSHLDGRLVVLEGLDVATDQDTLSGNQVVAQASTKFKIDVSINNNFGVSDIVIPLTWSGPYNLVFDSISVAGLRTSGFGKSLIANDLPNRRSVWELSSVSEIASGSGPVASVYFRMPSFAVGDSNLISFDPVFLIGAVIGNSCFSLALPVLPGSVKLPAVSACCVGITGNVDADAGNVVDISDLTALIDHLFISLAPLVCSGEGNTDGSLNSVVDISDLTALINFLFISLTPLPNCL